MATIAYVLAVATTYIANRSWSFSSKEAHSKTAPRYIVAYGIGYLNHMAWLYALTNIAGIRHEISQLLGAAITALLIFLILRLWVFRPVRHNEVS